MVKELLPIVLTGSIWNSRRIICLCDNQAVVACLHSTKRSYDSAMRRFNTFCERYHVLHPFPVTEFLLCSFAASLADEGLAPQTVKSYLAAIRNTQVFLTRGTIHRCPSLKGSWRGSVVPVSAMVSRQGCISL